MSEKIEPSSYFVQIGNANNCEHDWSYVFGLNARPHCIRIYDCKICGASKEIKTPKSKNGNYGTAVITIKEAHEKAE